jgi:hypothetical protein
VHELRRAHPSSGGSFRRGRSCDLYVTCAKVAQAVPGFAFTFFETTTTVVGTLRNFSAMQNSVAIGAWRTSSKPPTIQFG